MERVFKAAGRTNESPKAFEPGSSSAPALMATATFLSSSLDDESSDDDSFAVRGTSPHRPAVQVAAAAPQKMIETSREAGGAAAHPAAAPIAAASKSGDAKQGGLWKMARCWSRTAMEGVSPLAAGPVPGAAAHPGGAAVATPESGSHAGLLPGAAAADVSARGGGSGPVEAAPLAGAATKGLAAAAESAGAIPDAEGVFAPKTAFAFLARAGVKKGSFQQTVCWPEPQSRKIRDTLSSSGAALSNSLPLQGTRQLVPLGCQLSCLRHESQQEPAFTKYVSPNRLRQS